MRTSNAFTARQAAFEGCWRAYTAALQNGDKGQAADLRAELNEAYGLALKDWAAELGEEPLS